LAEGYRLTQRPSSLSNGLCCLLFRIVRCFAPQHAREPVPIRNYVA
jgi:hypothetical protein